MAAMNVGETIKITGANRHPEADALLLDNVNLRGAAIVDIGASDGSTSVDLINKLTDFKSYVIADLYLEAHAVTSGRHVFFYDPHGACILIVGPRLLAWPSISAAVRLLYAPLISRAAKLAAQRTEILLLNPATTKIIESDPRVTYLVHDVFQPWKGTKPDAIKVANLLRRLYFSDEEISRALVALLESLPEGGHLLIVDNPRIKEIDTRAGLYQRSEGRFKLVTMTSDEPEINDLIALARI